MGRGPWTLRDLVDPFPAGAVGVLEAMGAVQALVRAEAPWPLVLEALDAWEARYWSVFGAETMFETALVRQAVVEDAWR